MLQQFDKWLRLARERVQRGLSADPTVGQIYFGGYAPAPSVNPNLIRDRTIEAQGVQPQKSWYVPYDDNPYDSIVDPLRFYLYEGQPPLASAPPRQVNNQRYLNNESLLRLLLRRPGDPEGAARVIRPLV